MHNTSAVTSTRPSKSGKLLALCAAAALCAMAAASASAAPTLVNGSLTGDTGYGVTPVGWTVGEPTPDTTDSTHAVGIGSPFFTFFATPSASPDGGTWVSLLSDGSYPVKESFTQTVSGFTIGMSYTLTWYHANFGLVSAFEDAPFIDANAIEVLVNGSSIGSSSVMSVGTGWLEESLTFVADAATMDLTFTSLTLSSPGKTYQSIDGIRLAEIPPANAVPEPAALSLFSGAGLAMLLAARRRKQARKAD